jgi:hypothetical protein
MTYYDHCGLVFSSNVRKGTSDIDNAHSSVYSMVQESWMTSRVIDVWGIIKKVSNFCPGN